MMMHGKWVHAIDIEDAQHLVLRWADSKHRGAFVVRPETGMFAAPFPAWDEFGKIKRLNQSLETTFFPILLNHAATGHKLQGKSLDQLVIAQWSKQENWAHAALSRVRTLEGLFLTEEMPRDIEFSPSEAHHEMMACLRCKRPCMQQVKNLYDACK